MPDRLPREPLTTNLTWFDWFLAVLMAVLFAVTVTALVVKAVV